VVSFLPITAGETEAENRTCASTWYWQKKHDKKIIGNNLFNKAFITTGNANVNYSEAVM
jgi:hypothetical protein